MNNSFKDSEVEDIRKRVMQWGRKHYRSFPWRSTQNAWHGLVAEILLVRTRAENVVPVFDAFISRFPTPAKLARASVEEVEEIIHPLGLRWRAPLLKELGEHVVENEGEIPRDPERLTELPGAGPYTAAAWLSAHADTRGVLVDANVVRWLCRLIGRSYDGETRRKAWLRDLADRFTPSQNVKEYNYALLDFTAEICTPRNPSCAACPVGPNLCSFGREKLAAEGESKDPK